MQPQELTIFLVGCRTEMGIPGRPSNRRSEVLKCQVHHIGPMGLVGRFSFRYAVFFADKSAGFGRPNNSNAFGSIGSASRANPSRAATIRMAVRTACEKMDSRVLNGQASAWLRVEDLLREVQLMKAAHEVPINSAEMLEFCDIPGNTYNGDGSFTRLQDSSGWVIRYEPGRSSSIGGIERAVDIGSPSVGGTMPVIGGQRLFQQPGAY